MARAAEQTMSPSSAHSPTPAMRLPSRPSCPNTQYLARVVMLSEEDHGAVVLLYHMVFHRARAEIWRGDCGGWAIDDVKLLVHLINEHEGEGEVDKW
ncbi:uncharacterized protein B0H18DRAFT_1210553 [Fomitopsis serialis]|uniref:uncharacterized protein n=1 Tax=Fomitopsis serialis TaxID=139415 RepID=UPI002008A485|nr:uncharacterized protein B0H18DRAFT_1210553 [Neoantrodia serialis]KAH9927558.1 hypothetical protein B0H18DRAFT_1210553 [Neoantrodia serialis]